MFRFAEPRVFSVPELVKLTPALDYEQVAVGVRCSEKGELEVWGLLRYGRDRYRFLRGERTSMSNEFSLASVPFIVDAYAPGSLLVSIGHFRALRLQAGQFVRAGTPVFRASECPVYGVLNDWARVLPGLTPGREIEYVKAVQALVRGVHESGHGGTVVLLRNASDQFLRLGRGKPAEPFTEIRDRLSAYVAGLNEACKRDDALTVGLSTWDLVPRHSLDDALAAASALAGVDGALVLGADLAVRSFGAVIDWTPTDRYHARKALDTTGGEHSPYEVALRGTRHNSAVWLCWKRADALVFVVSEDGMLSCALQIEGEVTVWPNVDANHEFSLESLIALVEAGVVPLPKDLRHGASGLPVGRSLHGRS